MVDAITAISGSAATTPTQGDRSLSITSEPDNKWVAARQSRIDADQVMLRRAAAALDADTIRFAAQVDDKMEVYPDESFREDRKHETTADADGHPREDEARLSGESELIGTVDFDNKTRFGHRTAIV